MELVYSLLVAVFGVGSFFAKSGKLKRYLDFLLASAILANLLKFQSVGTAIPIFLLLTLFNFSLENAGLKERKANIVKMKNKALKGLNLLLGFAVTGCLSLLLYKEEGFYAPVLLEKTDIYNLLIILFLAFSFLKKESPWKT